MNYSLWKLVYAHDYLNFNVSSETYIPCRGSDPNQSSNWLVERELTFVPVI